MSVQQKITRERTSEGPSSTVKTTTYETTSSTSDDYAPHYRAGMAPRNLVIHRTSYGGPGKGGGSQSRSYSMQQQYGVSSGIPSGAYAAVTSTGVTSVRNSRVQEKKDMQDLNERFAGYIEKVRFLEAQNRRLADELDKLKQKWGKETTAIKAMYQAELDEARKLLDEAEKEKANLEIRNASLDEAMDEIRAQYEDVKSSKAADRERIDRQNQELSDYEAEINLLRRRLEQVENDREKDKKEIARLSEALNRARIDLDNETLNHIDAENRRQTLEEELEFLKQVHEQELKELASLAYRDTTAENREFWKNEMGQALREIQTTYDEKMDSMRGELETYYNMKIQEFRTGATRQNMETVHSKEETKRLRTQLTDMRSKLGELEANNARLEKELEVLRRESEDKEREWEAENSELKNEVAKLRAEMECILKELQDIMDTKLGLELEIAAYRKLLEGEENRIGLRSVVDSMMGFSMSGGGSSGGMSMGGGVSGGSGASMSMSAGGSGGGFSSTSAGASFTISSDGGHNQIESTDDDQSLKVSQVVKGEMSAKTTYQRSAKGSVCISECSSDGKFVVVENTGRKDENLGNWKIKRTIDGEDRAEYVFDESFSIRAGRKVRVYHKGVGQVAAGDLVARSVSNWGMGANITTKLVNAMGEDRATHVGRTVYTS